MMEAKKEMTVADFYYLSVIYSAIQDGQMLCEEIDAEGNEEMKSALDDMYVLAVKCVTRKDGIYPSNWYLPITDCEFRFSFDEANDLADKIEDFKIKFEELDNELSITIINRLTAQQVELAMECLLSSLVEL